MSDRKINRAVASMMARKGPHATMKVLGDCMVNVVSAMAEEVPEATGLTLAYPDGWIVDVFNRVAIARGESVIVEVKK